MTTMMWLFEITRAEGDTAPIDQFAETGSEWLNFAHEPYIGRSPNFDQRVSS